MPDRDVLYSKHVVGRGKALYEVARARGLEGIIAKRADSTYQERRSREWLKIKAVRRQEFVVGGWTEPRRSRTGFGALLLGVYDGDALLSVGSVGTGFDDRLLTEILAKLEPLERKTPAFASPPKTDTPAHWVQPKLVAEVAFAEWTDDDQLRHPSFVAMRADKDPREVVRRGARPNVSSSDRRRRRRVGQDSWQQRDNVTLPRFGKGRRLDHMAHAIWNGTINFGLVTIPVKLQTAIRTNDVPFQLFAR